MGAIATSLLTVLRGGDHVVAHSGVFDQTRKLLEGPLRATAGLPYDLDFVPEAAPDSAEPYRGFVRLSVGLEEPDDLIADMSQALD